MGERPSPTPAVPRRPLLAAGLLLLTLLSNTFGQSRPARLPATLQTAEIETVAAALRRLRKIPSGKLVRTDLALRAGLEFCAAVGKPSGAHAAGLLDVIGYQALPLEGELPERPDKPIDPKAFKERIDRRPRADVADISIDCFQVLDREDLRHSFPAVARWMLPDDLALVIEPPDCQKPNWVTRRACVVARVRGRKAVIVGGNLLDALRGAVSRPASGE